MYFAQPLQILSSVLIDHNVQQLPPTNEIFKISQIQKVGTWQNTFIIEVSYKTGAWGSVVVKALRY
jgi:hypothetical protein